MNENRREELVLFKVLLAFVFFFSCFNFFSCVTNQDEDKQKNSEENKKEYFTDPGPAGALFLIGFYGKDPEDEEVKKTRALLENGQAAGVVLLSRNLPKKGDPHYREKVKKLIKFLTEDISPPPIVSVDQEGGPVQRIKPDNESKLPSFRELGNIEDFAQARKVTFDTAVATAKELKELGITLNFSPVLDLYHAVTPSREDPSLAEEASEAKEKSGNEMALRLEKRSFGQDPQKVSLLGAEIIWGHKLVGVSTCAKHFPGHGITLTDTHYALPKTDIPTAFLKQYELIPFISAIGFGVPAVMSSHIINSELDAENPATLSKAVMTDLLRKRLGFNGVIITDDMTMDAIRKLENGNAQAAINALKAGADLVIFAWRPEDFLPAFEAVQFAISTGELNREQILLSKRRIEKLLRSSD